MKNIDKVKDMTAEELARFILHDKCDSCSLECRMKCVEGMSEWLNQEANPMPELQIGDVLELESDGCRYCRYYYIGNDVAIRTISPAISKSVPVVKQCASELKRRIIKIWRENGNTGYDVIWSAGDNGDWLEKAIKEGKAAYCSVENNKLLPNENKD